MLEPEFWQHYMRNLYHPVVSRLYPHQQLTNLCVTYLRSRPMVNETVMDIGCGTGIITRELLRQLHESVNVISLDRSSAALAVATHNLKGEKRVTLVEGDACETLGVEDNRLAGIVSVNALYAMPDPERFLEHCAAALAPGARLVIANPYKPKIENIMRAQQEYLNERASPQEIEVWETLNRQGILDEFHAANARIVSESTDPVRFLSAPELVKAMEHVRLRVTTVIENAYEGTDVLVVGQK